MATAQEIINGALRLLAVIQTGETPTSSESDDSLDALNQMLSGWADQGIDLEHADLVLGDTLPYQDNHLAAIRYSLAVELAPEFGKSITPEIADRQDRYFRGLQAVYADPSLLGTDAALDAYYNPNNYL